MPTLTLSPKFQVVIPKEIREKLQLRPGQHMEAFAYDSRIELVPVHPTAQMRGFLKDSDSSVTREPDRP